MFFLWSTLKFQTKHSCLLCNWTLCFRPHHRHIANSLGLLFSDTDDFKPSHSFLFIHTEHSFPLRAACRRGGATASCRWWRKVIKTWSQPSIHSRLYRLTGRMGLFHLQRNKCGIFMYTNKNILQPQKRPFYMTKLSYVNKWALVMYVCYFVLFYFLFNDPKNDLNRDYKTTTQSKLWVLWSVAPLVNRTTCVHLLFSHVQHVACLLQSYFFMLYTFWFFVARSTSPHFREGALRTLNKPLTNTSFIWLSIAYKWLLNSPCEDEHIGHHLDWGAANV